VLMVVFVAVLYMHTAINDAAGARLHHSLTRNVMNNAIKRVM